MSNYNKIEELLKKEEYSFIHNNNFNYLFMTLGGSHGYGTNVETSDYDVRGIIFPSKMTMLGLNKFEQFEDRNTDTVLYEISKFFTLAANCNPNVIELLGCDNHLPENDRLTKKGSYFMLSEEGKDLINNSHLFLSKRAFNSFVGYATSQLRRLENNLARYEVSQERKEEHIKDSIVNMLNKANDRYKDFHNHGKIELYVDDSDKQEFDKEIFININLNNYPLRDFNGIYSEMNNIIKDYEKLGQRNSKKDDLHLNKHMMHLVRLYLTGIDVLENEIIITNRSKDIDLLMDIRNGKYLNHDGSLNSSFMDLVNALDKKMKYADSNTSLPKTPNYSKLNEYLVELKLKHLKKVGVDNV